jgi:hypothetical protein
MREAAIPSLALGKSPRQGNVLKLVETLLPSSE